MFDKMIYNASNFDDCLMNTGQFAIYRESDGQYLTVVQAPTGVYLMKMGYMDIIMLYFANMAESLLLSR